ncbi:hypothetical protein LEP1GSC175_1482 [Leptospira santarosai str. HAI821]|nr:hypothetical protein LEP1GSC175_1482 [Leptospira santarosai str. HAI821]
MKYKTISFQSNYLELNKNQDPDLCFPKNRRCAPVISLLRSLDVGMKYKTISFQSNYLELNKNQDPDL